MTTAATNQMETENKSRELKHLWLVRIAAIHTLACVSNLYECAKQNSGSLRSTVGTVEGAVTTVVGPVYAKFKGVPEDLLEFVDKKVDDATHKLDEHAPPLVKQVASEAQTFVQKASEKAQKLVIEARTGGPRAAFNYAATESKQFILVQSVKLWIKLNNYPQVHSVTKMAVPTAAHLLEKYNNVVKAMAQKGYPIFGYIPLVSVDDIGKAFKQAEAGNKEDTPSHESE
ncbi:REF/SRPP-like protein [Tripterygium wilfordii]|uniref:REF/SRPP-like protein n=1 Tax=Tripterygium wilfordii TaxID=458696 RepID=A0A7J7DJF1_TRIWF|nr:REF/SRPP-like protein At1g67360 [Tripterygium wilfordii]XP_038702726.1 REF/SRPP-like protein At1g67360 [Tripterygium wilfordii]KAF5746443.1 REF/SRPP-like protein [Tripterygium wilfordii]